jgi:hypothetical protein
LKNDYVFAVFYLSIISVSFFGSLYGYNLNSNENLQSDNDYSKQTIFVSGNDADVQGISIFTSTNLTWMNFTFLWGSDTQRIVQGEFQLDICLRWNNNRNTVTKIVIMVNDDDYNAGDYVGLVFDTNKNGYIDSYDISRGLFANNMTQPSILTDSGFLCFAECIPTEGLQVVSFDPDQGYVFTIPPTNPVNLWFPMDSINIGSNNRLHVCFYDRDGGSIFTRFLFYIPEGS